MIITDTNTIISFLSGLTPDYRGRSYSDMINLSDYEIEKCHDQIQWLFPLHEASKRAITYPVLTPETVEECKKHGEILANLCIAKDRFERFLGIGAYEDTSRHFQWCKDRNHNLLRITRAIRSLRLFGLESEATDLYDKVKKVADMRLGYPESTVQYWDKALNDDVWSSLQD